MKISLLGLLIIVLSGCNHTEHKSEQSVYFDAKAYFKKEAMRLTAMKNAVNKTVVINGNLERKKVFITNWDQEFNSFIEADINKASWRGSFNVAKSASSIIYTTENKKIPVKKLEVLLSNEKVVGIKVFITNKNDLFESNDSLTYYPDSIYEIKKTQHIKLMKAKQYQITGKFK